MTRRRKTKAAKGGRFENRLKDTCTAYAAAGIATLEKVDPPTRTITVPGRSRPLIKHLPNPYLDFTGAWTEQGGRMVMMEAKCVEGKSLPLRTASRGGGISESQLEWAETWERAGAATCFLWHREELGETRFLTPAMCRATLTTRKSVRWCDAHPVPQGDGFILIDFLALLRVLTPQHRNTHEQQTT